MEEKNSIQVLLAEDDRNLGSILKSYLEAKGFPTLLCVNGEEALETYRREPIDFCIIDVMMPVKDGFSLAAEIREDDKEVPILFLTAKSLQEDVLRGFEVGGDDYLTKPFSMEVLLARMQAILRRAIPEGIDESKEIFELGRLAFDSVRQTLDSGGKVQKLTSKESDLLRLLCLRKNQVLDRTEALKRIWGDDSYFNARSMDVYITKLRKYLKEDPSVRLLNVHGIGFKLVVG
jgi:DNA-binding response OmpR family regulator